MEKISGMKKRHELKKLGNESKDSVVDIFLVEEERTDGGFFIALCLFHHLVDLCARKDAHKSTRLSAFNLEVAVVVFAPHDGGWNGEHNVRDWVQVER